MEVATDSDMASCIASLFAINQNKQIRERKNILYRGREM